tara:strand:+ start:5489 stop:7765 length:2277 start_codon:yes stop_codon:yes gene_type:complete
MITFNEKINLDNARYLLSLGDNKLIKLFNPDYFENGEKCRCDAETYIKQMSRWLKRSIKLQEKYGSIKEEYFYSRNLQTTGRIYVEGFGVQRLQKTFRGFLIKEYVNDYDMVNAHPTILNNIINTTFREEKHLFPLINKYIHNREYFLNQDDITKKQVLTSMNSNKSQYSDNQIFVKLDQEFKSIQKLVWSEYEKRENVSPTILSHKSTLKQNKEGKFLNVILVQKENEILQEVMKKFNDGVNTPMFDGFTLDKQIDCEEVLKILNETTLDRGVKWDVKEHDDSIVIDEGVEIEYHLEYTYEEQKEIYEENHFIIENPFLFGKITETDGEYEYHLDNISNFRLKCKPIKFFDMEKKKSGVEFLPIWIGDRDRKCYKEIRFVPDYEYDERFFNSFRGFPYTKVENLPTSNIDTISIFNKHLGLLTNYDEDSIEYVTKYLAHLIQKSKEKPQTALMFKSKQGFGKDRLIDIIQKLIGTKHVYRTQKMESVFGDWNVSIRDKLVLQLNEASGKDGFLNKEEIKDIITTEQINIREKYINQYSQKNYIRLIITSNNLNPVEISHDDRRFVVFKSHYKKPSTEYFETLTSLIESDDCIQILFNYLSEVDISDYDPRKRPITDAYENMRSHSQNPIYEFLYNCFIRDKCLGYFGEGNSLYSKSKDTFMVRSSSFFNTYKSFLISENKGNIEPSYKLVKAILGDIGIQQKRKLYKGCRSEFYEIENENLINQLETYDFDEEIDSLDGDEFENMGLTYDETHSRLI